MEHLEKVRHALQALIQGLEAEQHVSLRYYRQVEDYFQRAKDPEDISYILERLIAIGPVAQYQNMSATQNQLFIDFLSAAQSFVGQRH